MIHNIPFVAYCNCLKNTKQKLIDQSNDREKSKCLHHIYGVNDKVLLTKLGIHCKLSTPKEGPYLITRIHTSGMVKIQ